MSKCPGHHVMANCMFLCWSKMLSMCLQKVIKQLCALPGLPWNIRCMASMLLVAIMIFVGGTGVSMLMSRFMTPDWVTDHVTGQVTFHRPFPCLSMFVDVCLHMFGHLTFLGNCI